MQDPDTFITSFLEHAGSEFYDPVKAHEYYLRNRELKGRRPSQNVSDLKTTRQREGWSYVKSKLKEAKTTDRTAVNKTYSENVAKLRTTADKRRNEIRSKLAILIGKLSVDRKTQLAKLDTDRKTQLEKVAANIQKQIDAVPPVPLGVGKARREELSNLRSIEISKIRGEGRAQKAAILTKTSAARSKTSGKTAANAKALKDTAGSDREKVSESLKTSINSARGNYTKLKADLKAKYETKAQNEFDTIKNTVR
jgi:hypothetical protein